MLVLWDLGLKFIVFLILFPHFHTILWYNYIMNERDIRAVENMARTGMSFDELRKAFKEFSIEEVEKIYMRIRRERNLSSQKPPFRMNGS